MLAWTDPPSTGGWDIPLRFDFQRPKAADIVPGEYKPQTGGIQRFV